MKPRLDERALLTLALTACAGAFALLSLTLGPVARRVPLVVGSGTFALLIYQCWAEIARGAAAPESDRGPRRRERELAMLATILVLAVLVALAGPAPAAGLYVLFHLRVLGGEAWGTALAFAGGFLVLTTALLRSVLQVRLCEGPLWTWLGSLLG
ncbi:MAG: hypothetical protein ACYC9Y_12595 [Candidatus Methylomirabilia bacterium]